MTNEPSAAAFTRPEPPYEPAPGRRWTAVRAPAHFHVAEPGKTCRFPVPPGKRACGRPGVIALMRGIKRDTPWYYCDWLEHSYGAWAEPGPDGVPVVMRWAEEDIPEEPT